MWDGEKYKSCLDVEIIVNYKSCLDVEIIVNLHGSATSVLKFFDEESLPLPGVGVVLLNDVL